MAGFIGIRCLLSLSAGFELISIILSFVGVAVDGLGSGVIWMVLASFGFMLLGVLITVDIVDTGI